MTQSSQRLATTRLQHWLAGATDYPVLATTRLLSPLATAGMGYTLLSLNSAVLTALQIFLSGLYVLAEYSVELAPETFDKLFRECHRN